MEIRNRTAPKEQLLGLLDIFEHTASDLEETQKSIEKEKMRVAGIRGEIRSYFERYRQDARAKAAAASSTSSEHPIPAKPT